MLTVQELSDMERGNVWLLNTSDNVVDGGGDVNIAISTAGGQSEMLRLPKSWLPINATLRIARKHLLDSQSLLNAISRGVVCALTEDEAQELLRRPGAEYEKQRLRDDESRQRQATEQRGIGKNVFITGGNDDDNEEAPAETLKSAGPQRTSLTQKVNLAPKPKSSSFDLTTLLSEEEPEVVEDNSVSTAFKGWVQKLNASSGTEERLNMIRNRAQLSSEEATYLRDNLNDTRIVASLTARLQKAGG